VGAQVIAAALEPGVIIAIVVLVVTIASALVYAGLGGTLTRWRESVEAPPAGPSDESLREEVRQLVVADNARRERRGEEPLDVDAEVERRLRELAALDIS
jgi:hypothetical protein